MDPLPAEEFDEFDPKNLGLPERLRNNGQSPIQQPRARTKSQKLYVEVLVEHVRLLVSARSTAEFAVYCVLFQTWFANSNRWNPVRLNMTALRKLGIGRYAAHRALKKLKRKNLVFVNQRPGRSPLVTLRWKELNKHPNDD